MVVFEENISLPSNGNPDIAISDIHKRYSKIIFIIFWDLMFYQIFSTPQVKQSALISNKHVIHEFPYKLPNTFRLTIIGNQSRWGTSQNPTGLEPHRTMHKPRWHDGPAEDMNPMPHSTPINPWPKDHWSPHTLLTPWLQNARPHSPYTAIHIPIPIRQQVFPQKLYPCYQLGNSHRINLTFIPRHWIGLGTNSRHFKNNISNIWVNFDHNSKDNLSKLIRSCVWLELLYSISNQPAYSTGPLNQTLENQRKPRTSFWFWP